MNKKKSENGTFKYYFNVKHVLFPQLSGHVLKTSISPLGFAEYLVKACAYYLEHVCIAVVGVLHHHHLDSGQSVRDAVLVFVAYGLKEQKRDKTDEYGKR